MSNMRIRDECTEIACTCWHCRKNYDVIKWKRFPRNWPFVRGIHRSPVNSPHKGQWRGALMFSLICVWINGWANNREAGDLRRRRGYYDVSVMNEGNFVTYHIIILPHTYTDVHLAYTQRKTKLDEARVFGTPFTKTYKVRLGHGYVVTSIILHRV